MNDSATHDNGTIMVWNRHYDLITHKKKHGFVTSIHLIRSVNTDSVDPVWKLKLLEVGGKSKFP
jgi:hypothetical protein